jgi:hypothetical protein
MRRAAHGGLEHAPVAPISSVRLIDDLVADIYAAQLGLPQP